MKKINNIKLLTAVTSILILTAVAAIVSAGADEANGKDVNVQGVTVLKEANWIHGTDFNVEYPNLIYRTDIKGWGKTYYGQPDTFNWFHIAIPSTVISDGKRNQLVKAFVLFKTDGNATITNVHLWDGPNQIKQFNNLKRNGDHSTGIDAMNTFEITPRDQMWGLDIVVGVQFGKPDSKNPQNPNILFTTAGADFYQ